MEKPVRLWAAATADLSAALRDDKKGYTSRERALKPGLSESRPMLRFFSSWEFDVLR
jgi:hypothetical protein